MDTIVISRLVQVGERKQVLDNCRETLTIEEASRGCFYETKQLLYDYEVGYALAALHDDLFMRKMNWRGA